MESSSSSEANPMAVRQPRYSKEEFAQRGDEIYEAQVRSKVEEGNHGKIVAIDIETEAFEVADDIVTASEHLLTRVPDAQTWFIRIGHQAVYHFGARSLRKSV
jgi:histidinol dehydrogenase